MDASAPAREKTDLREAFQLRSPLSLSSSCWPSFELTMVGAVATAHTSIAWGIKKKNNKKRVMIICQRTPHPTSLCTNASSPDPAYLMPPVRFAKRSSRCQCQPCRLREGWNGPQRHSRKLLIRYHGSQHNAAANSAIVILPWGLI